MRHSYTSKKSNSVIFIFASLLIRINFKRKELAAPGEKSFLKEENPSQKGLCPSGKQTGSPRNAKWRKNRDVNAYTLQQKKIKTYFSLICRTARIALLSTSCARICPYFRYDVDQPAPPFWNFSLHSKRFITNVAVKLSSWFVQFIPDLSLEAFNIYLRLHKIFKLCYKIPAKKQ